MIDEEYLKKYLEPSKLEEGLKLLKEGLPVQYIIGNVDFMGNIIEVNSNVLIPRFETELLVSKTINYIKKRFNRKIKILDIGTGSGAIAIALKKNIDCDVTACDISPKALEVAKRNALKNEVDINFIESDLFNNINNKYDVIISNPPYISYDEQIDLVVRNNEPAIALFAGNNGLEFYEKILSKASNYLNNNSIFAFEIGKDQGKYVSDIASKYFPGSTIKVEKDFTDRERFVFIT